MSEARAAHVQQQGPFLSALLINLKQILLAHEIKSIAIGLWQEDYMALSLIQ